MGGKQSISVFSQKSCRNQKMKNFSENENENEKLFREQKLSPFSEKFLLKNIAQNGLYLGEHKLLLLFFLAAPK